MRNIAKECKKGESTASSTAKLLKSAENALKDFRLDVHQGRTI